MKRTTYQVPELRDENDNIIQQGAFGKNTALANSTNDGWIDYVANDLEALYNNTMGGTGGEINTETITGKTGTITNLTATTVKAGTLTADALNGPLTGNVTGTADKAVADGDGNNIVNTYVTKSAVQGELTNYLPLSGGTLTGDVDITGDLFVEGAITGNVTGNVTGAATSATNDGNGNNIASTYLPAVVGVVQAFAGSTTPQGWLLCDGSAVSRKTYASLYACIGTTYGSGNGSTTFNLPNLVDKFVEGSATAGTVKSAGLPNITGSIGIWMWMIQYSSRAFSAESGGKPRPASTSYSGTGYAQSTFDASRSNSIYGNSTTVQPPALTMRYIIKY